jgi:hypothetical protein
MIVGSGYETIAWGFVLLLAGIPVYVWMTWRARERERPPVALEALPQQTRSQVRTAISA